MLVCALMCTSESCHLAALLISAPPPGVLETGTYVLSAAKGKKERVGRLMEMHANSREDVKLARAGDIVAVGPQGQPGSTANVLNQGRVLLSHQCLEGHADNLQAGMGLQVGMGH